MNTFLTSPLAWPTESTLLLNPEPIRTMIFEDSQVEAWHEMPEVLVPVGGAFHSTGSFTLIRSYLTASWH